MTVLSLVLFSRAAAAATIIVAWDPNPEPDIAGYVVSYGTASGSYTNSVAVNQTWQAISGLGDGTTYYFVVRAYNTSGQYSAPSAEVSATTPRAGTPPTITCPVPSATSSTGQPVAVSFAPTTAGGVAPLTVGCSPASGSLFPVGSTPFSCTVTDALQQSATCASMVAVTSQVRPGLTCPTIPPVTSYDGGPVGVTYPLPVVSGGVAPVNTQCTPASGMHFPVGSTTVMCTATDAVQQTASCSTTVTVKATSAAASPLALTCPVIAPARAHSGSARVTYPAPTATGGVAPITSVCTPPSGSKFGLGTTLVTCTAQDAVKQVASCSIRVVVSN